MSESFARVSLSWDELQVGLTTVLAGFEDRVRLVIRWSPDDDVYVQCAQDEGTALTLDAVSDHFLPAARAIGETGAQAMAALGWTPPRYVENFQFEIAWPGRTAEFERGAAAMIGALRDVYRVPEPGVLSYSAWREAEPAPDYVESLAELDRGDPDLALPALRLERVQR